MGFSSQAGQVLFRSQSVNGAFAADFDAEHVAMKLRSGSLGASRELLITDPEIGGGRDTTDGYLGAASWSGDYEFYARMDSVTTMLFAALGEGSSALEGAAGAHRHTITPLDSAELPLLSIEERIGSGLETFNYYDAAVNTFHLEAEANGYLMGTAGLIARVQEAGKTPTAEPSWDDSKLTVGTNISLTFGGVQLPAKSFALDINNSIEDDDFRLGSFYIGDMTAKSREVNGSFTVRPENSDLWRRAVYGATAATTVQGISAKSPLIIHAETYEDIPGADAGIKYSIDFNMGQVALEPFNLEPSGDDVIENDISWRALRPVAANPILTAEVVNSKSSIA